MECYLAWLISEEREEERKKIKTDQGESRTQNVRTEGHTQWQSAGSRTLDSE